MRRTTIASLVAVLAFACMSPTVGADTKATGILVQAFLKTGASKIGELGRENETHVEILDINTGQATTFPKADLIRVNKDLSDDFAAQTVGLASVIAWKISQLVPAEKPQGTIANIDGATLYVSLGSRNGVGRGDKIRVFRGESEIKDPTTGEILGKQRRMISELEVFESQVKFCKAKQLGELEIPLAVGDLIEPTDFSNAIAIFPPLTSSNAVTEAGVRISEDLTTALVKRGIQVVERKLLLTTLTELAIEQTALFDEATAAKVGKQAGAYGVLSGTLTSDGKNVRANLRLIEVETGRIRFTISSRLKDDVGKLIEPSTSAREILPTELGRSSIGTTTWSFDRSIREFKGRRLALESVGEIGFAPGKHGKAVVCDGKSFLRIPSSGSQAKIWNGDFTIACWVLIEDANVGGIIVRKGEYGNPPL